MYYAGIGSRKTPKHVLGIMYRVAQRLESLGWTLRSGHAQGADMAFESGARTKDIFTADDCTKQAMELSSKFHPAWDRLGGYIKKLMGRNAMQILGKTLTCPAKFVLCWTPDGAEERTKFSTGGTGQAIRIANHYGIPVFNMKNEDALERLGEYLKTI